MRESARSHPPFSPQMPATAGTGSGQSWHFSPRLPYGWVRINSWCHLCCLPGCLLAGIWNGECNWNLNAGIVTLDVGVSSSVLAATQNARPRKDVSIRWMGSILSITSLQRMDPSNSERRQQGLSGDITMARMRWLRGGRMPLTFWGVDLAEGQYSLTSQGTLLEGQVSYIRPELSLRSQQMTKCLSLGWTVSFPFLFNTSLDSKPMDLLRFAPISNSSSLCMSFWIIKFSSLSGNPWHR